MHYEACQNLFNEIFLRDLCSDEIQNQTIPIIKNESDKGS